MNSSPGSFRGSERFRVVESLGSGATGEVFHVVDLGSQANVALKALREASPDLLRLFKREFRAMRTFATRTSSRSAAGKVHRDVKPSNVLVTAGGRVVIVDFGILVDRRERRDESDDTFSGTLAYMAPEQAMSNEVGPAADWYAVGVVLFEALTRRLPFEGSTTEVLSRKIAESGPPPRLFAPSVPSDLNDLCTDLPKLDPQERPTGDEITRRLGLDPDDTDTPREPSVEQIFVGRQSELAALRDAYAVVRGGASPSAWERPTPWRSRTPRTATRTSFLGDWARAIGAFARAEATFRDRCGGVHYYINTTRTMPYRALTWAARRDELRQRSGPALRDAVQRGDIHTVQKIKCSASFIVALADDRVADARRLLDEVKAELPADSFIVQHSFHLAAEVQLGLYSGRSQEAHALLVAAAPAVRRSLLWRISALEVQRRGLFARCAVASAEAGGAGRQAWLAEARRQVALLRRIDVSFVPGLADLHTAGVLACEGARDEAVALRRKAILELDAAGLRSFAIGGRRHLARLIGGDEGGRSRAPSRPSRRRRGSSTARRSRASTRQASAGSRPGDLSAGVARPRAPRQGQLFAVTVMQVATVSLGRFVV